MRNIYLCILCVLLCFPLTAAELPRPTYDNSMVIAFAYYLRNATDTEVNYLKSQFGNGMYAPLVFSNFAAVSMDWLQNPANADTSINTFKELMDSYFTKAKKYGVGLHLILNFGVSRNSNIYKAAKIEDIRNAQWYTDNNLASLDQLARVSRSNDQEEQEYTDELKRPTPTTEMAASSININEYVYGTHSRYARKMRAHLEAKALAAFGYLKKKQTENPDVLLIISAPGEAELNSLRLDHSHPLQDFVCDYSPFAVLEFRDWITNQGMYATNGKYAGQGYPNGANLYSGSTGLNRFNQDFGTHFTSWNLKYYHWNLNDEIDTNYSDGLNPDANTIPLTAYSYDGMKPTSGPNYIAGGFDPPRTMYQKGENAFWDLWNQFRETMIYHYVKDIADIAKKSGLNNDYYYSHQIPADYLFGTSPNEPTIPYLNPRYYGSASPLWTADVNAGKNIGVTMYDINFGTWYARTSQYLVPQLANKTNWGAMEYNPEVVADGVTIAPETAIYQEILRLYNAGAHVVSFYKWIENHGSEFKGTNRELAAKLFFDAIKNKARTSIDTMLTPPLVNTFKATYDKTANKVTLSWSNKIWSDLKYTWSGWGDFKEFILYRGTSAGFTPNASNQIARLTGVSYVNNGPFPASTMYYKVVAVNQQDEPGSAVTVAVNTTSTGGVPVLQVNTSTLAFGAIVGSTNPTPQSFLISNTGTGTLNWSIEENCPWLSCSPTSGINDNTINVNVNISGKSTGVYQDTITIKAPGSTSPTFSITVTLTISTAGDDEPPFGYFETPLEGSTAQGSIPVTGWALDDVGIQSITLYREENGKLLWVGDAIRVEGARPDVAQAYPQFPENSKAGWGYMLLTNFLPNNGNGTFVLHAIAKDVYGHETSLGTRTIYCDNEHAVKPFGAIDTPAQGGVAAGKNYLNYGWALTPQPNKIPINGTTIDVYVDGVKLGHPVYNNYRSDIATLFPGYANSNGAVGYFYLDTTTYKNGVHTISWMARDDHGNEEGIGSRYFNIQNSGADKSSSSSSFFPSKTKNTFIPNARSVVYIRKGNSEYNSLYSQVPDQNGVIHIEIQELEPVEVHLGQGTVQNISSLPIGATLDKTQRIFYWQPGLAFVGDYMFELVMKNKTGNFEKKKLQFHIKPKGFKNVK